mmetsp:Transcript_7491/g.13739  ORF Transcript_7491/g.13739 Transcript_7491/m.13739 type:complete len:81 (-) Transcript_7491:30-272(-)
MVDKAEERRVPEETAAAWCSKDTEHKIPYFETSAKDAVGIDDAFLAIARAALEQDSQEDVYVPNTLKVTSQDERGSNSCC